MTRGSWYSLFSNCPKFLQIWQACVKLNYKVDVRCGDYTICLKFIKSSAITICQTTIRKEKNKNTLFSSHTGSLLRRQPGATTTRARTFLTWYVHACAVQAPIQTVGVLGRTRKTDGNNRAVLVDALCRKFWYWSPVVCPGILGTAQPLFL